MVLIAKLSKEQDFGSLNSLMYFIYFHIFQNYPRLDAVKGLFVAKKSDTQRETSLTKHSKGYVRANTSYYTSYNTNLFTPHLVIKVSMNFVNNL